VGLVPGAFPGSARLHWREKLDDPTCPVGADRGGNVSGAPEVDGFAGDDRALPARRVSDTELRLPPVIHLRDEHRLSIGREQRQGNPRGSALSGHDGLDDGPDATGTRLAHDQPLDLEFPDADAVALLLHGSH
jgi:hypothetical protein